MYKQIIKAQTKTVVRTMQMANGEELDATIEYCYDDTDVDVQNIKIDNREITETDLAPGEMNEVDKFVNEIITAEFQEIFNPQCCWGCTCKSPRNCRYCNE